MQAQDEVCGYLRAVDAVRHISVAELAQLGLARIAYLKSAWASDGSAVYAVHAADGTPLADVDDIAAAIELACQSELILVTVH